MISVTSVSAQFNSNPTLKIGDPAPPVAVKSWVRGEPITEFEKGKVYVLDFWATWCGGCIASFPHISAVAEKYKGQVHFASIDSYEDAGENKGKDPVGVVTEFLKKPRGQKLTIDVGVDGSANTMFETWIKPLRRQGFPTTFVINQEGKIAWIDVNLDHLDWVLGQVLAGTWDLNKAASVMKQKDALEDMMIKAFTSKETDRSGEYQDILTAAESFEKQFPDRKDASSFYKFMALLELDIDKVPAILEEMAANPLSRYINLSDAAGLTLMKQNLSQRTYSAVAKVQERLLLNEYPEKGYGGKSVKAYKELADTYDKASDPSNAVASIKKAILLAKEQNVAADQQKELETVLQGYLDKQK